MQISLFMSPMESAHRSNTPVLSSECHHLVDFPCVINLLRGHVSIYSKNVEKQGEIYTSVLSGHWYVTSKSHVWFELSYSSFKGLLIPLPGVIATLTMENYGHAIANIPPHFCGPANSDLVFYSLILLNNVILVIGIPMLIIIAWSLHKVWF